MKKETVLVAVVVLLVGVLIGLIISGKSGQEAPRGNQGSAQAPLVNYEQEIRQLKAVLAQEPGNHRAWVALGNSYFNSKQPQLAIEAYDRALALEPNDANVLTDQGTMYRWLSMYEQAIANFKKASAIDPSHLNSVFNTWVVARQDLQDLDEAKKAIERYLEIAPNGPKAELLRADLQAMNSAPLTPQLPEGHPPISTGQPQPGGAQ